MSGLVLENLTKSFDGQPVLNDVNLEVGAGELAVVLGPSGCGKSTLLRLIAGLESPDAGRIFLEGQDITPLEPQKRRAAMVFQNYALYPHMTVFENMAFPLRAVHRPKNEIRQVVHDTARLLELEEFLNRRPAQLSGGQRQRVALGRGLVRQPAIFLMDEPLSNLDAALRIKMRQEIVALQKRLGITMIYVTHDQTEALTMADRVAVLKDGRIRQIGSPAQIYGDPDDVFVAGFVGTPPINLIRDELQQGYAKRLRLHLKKCPPDGPVTLGIRPEHIIISTAGELNAEATAAEFVGAATHVRLRRDDLELTAVIWGQTSDGKIGDGQEKALPAGTLRFDIDPQSVLFFDPADGRRIRPTTSISSSR